MSDIVSNYFKAFNAGDTDAMLACLSEDVTHYVNEGGVRQGKAMFRAFCDHMSETYREELTDIVLLQSEDGNRAAAEFVVNGTYLKTDEGLPAAHGQTYKLPGGSFFTLENGQITRITTYYNLADWLDQIA